MFCLSEIALAFHHLLCRDEVHMKSQWLWIHLLLLFSTDNWLEQWNVCVCSLWNHTPCLFSGGLTTLLHPTLLSASFFSQAIASGACMKMTSLTRCIRTCHSDIWILTTDFFCQSYFFSLCANREQAYSRRDGQTQNAMIFYLSHSIYFRFLIKILI